jgi:hypothetical protein
MHPEPPPAPLELDVAGAQGEQLDNQRSDAVGNGRAR